MSSSCYGKFNKKNYNIILIGKFARNLSFIVKESRRLQVGKGSGLEMFRIRGRKPGV